MNKQLAALLEKHEAQFNWNEEDKTWCLSGTTREGNGWETDDYDAESQEEAEGDAINYLIAYNEE